MRDKEKEKNKAEEGLEKEESRNKRPKALGTREVRIPVVQAGQCPQVTPHFRPALVLQRPASLWTSSVIKTDHLIEVTFHLLK